MTEAELLKLMQGGERVWQSSVKIPLGRGIAARRRVDFERPRTAAGRHHPGSHPSVWQGLYHPVRVPQHKTDAIFRVENVDRITAERRCARPFLAVIPCKKRYRL